MQSIGFIGVGVMGRFMVKNLLKAGYQVAIYSRTKSKLEDFLAENDVTWCDSAAECASGRDAVITMVGYPKDVEQVYFGQEGILAAAQPGTYLIDMTTTDPKLSVRIAEEGTANGLHVLDAPVSGGDTGAKNGTLSIMVGGEEADFQACLPLFEAMGKQIVYEGPAGAGQHTKMANQIAIAGTIAGVSEALTYAERAGLDTAEDAGQHFQGCSRFLADGKSDAQNDARGLCARLFPQALHQGYEDCAGAGLWLAAGA